MSEFCLKLFLIVSIFTNGKLNTKLLKSGKEVQKLQIYDMHASVIFLENIF